MSYISTINLNTLGFSLLDINMFIRLDLCVLLIYPLLLMLMRLDFAALQSRSGLLLFLKQLLLRHFLLAYDGANGMSSAHILLLPMLLLVKVLPVIKCGL